ncbi:MAG: ATP-dependent Clp protease adapter ClpS [SAR86 cluster bacterium]|jgi:ATP-dependent Clp protease adaptor protein ClpS|nr:ATP-dependent Clp protease adapter ClpS [SAR86 cluster bacterium]
MFIDNTRSELILGPDEDQEDQEDQGTSVAVATIEPKLKKPPLYRVVIFNDDYTPMEFVVYVLQTFFGIDRDKATQIMLAIHTHGKGVCGIFTKEVAETKSAQVNNFARENEHPLISEIEPVDEE